MPLALFAFVIGPGRVPTVALRAACVGLCLVLALAGCGRDDSAPLRVAGWLSSPVEEGLTRSLIETFEQRHPDLPVHYEPITANYMDKLLLMLGTRTAPDVVMLESFWIPRLIGYDLLSPLDERVAGEPGFDLHDFEPVLLDALRANGRLYALPKDYSTLALYYNPALLAEAGLPGPPETWAEFADYARRLTRDTDGDGKIDRHGYAHAEMLEYSLPFVWQNGGEYFDGQGRAAFTEPPFVEALAFLQRLIIDGVAVLPTQVGAAWNMDAFGRRRVAMALSGLWAINFLENTFPEVPFAVAPLPVGKQRATVVFVVGYAIPKATRQPDWAWQLLSYITGREGGRIWEQAGVGLPARRSVVRELDLADDATRRTFIEGLAYARPWRFDVSQRVLDETESALQAIFITGAPVQPTLVKLKERLARAGLLVGGQAPASRQAEPR